MVFGRASSGVLGLTTLVALQCLAAPVHAYCRSRTCSLGKEEEVAEVECRHENGCLSEGKTLRWASPCLRYAVQVDGSPLRGLDGDELAELVEQAFALWKSSECPGGGNPRFEASFQGFVACHERETVCAGANGNVNVVMVHDEVWPYDFNELGITTPAAGIDSGVIHDADIELNGLRLTSSVDMFPVLAHEIGHFLGLGHSNVEGALMSAYFTSLGVSGELLTADDMAGICAVYPPSDATLSCSASEPARDACAFPEQPIEECRLATVNHATNDGCSVAPVGQKRPNASLVVFGAALGLSQLLRRRGRMTDSRRRA